MALDQALEDAKQAALADMGYGDPQPIIEGDLEAAKARALAEIDAPSTQVVAPATPQDSLAASKAAALAEMDAPIAMPKPTAPPPGMRDYRTDVSGAKASIDRTVEERLTLGGKTYPSMGLPGYLFPPEGFRRRFDQTGDLNDALHLTMSDWGLPVATAGDHLVEAGEAIGSVVKGMPDLAVMAGKAFAQNQQRKTQVKELAEADGLGELYSAPPVSSNSFNAAYLGGVPKMFAHVNLNDLFGTEDPIGSATEVVTIPSKRTSKNGMPLPRDQFGLPGAVPDDGGTLSPERSYTLIHMDRLPESMRTSENLFKIAGLRKKSDEIDKAGIDMGEVAGVVFNEWKNGLNRVWNSPVQAGFLDMIDAVSVGGLLNIGLKTVARARILAQAGNKLRNAKTAAKWTIDRPPAITPLHPDDALVKASTKLRTVKSRTIKNLPVDTPEGGFKGFARGKARFLDDAVSGYGERITERGIRGMELVEEAGKSPAGMAVLGDAIDETLSLGIHPIKASKIVFDHVYESIGKTLPPAARQKWNALRRTLFTNMRDLMEYKGLSGAVEIKASHEAARKTSHGEMLSVINKMVTKGIKPMAEEIVAGAGEKAGRLRKMRQMHSAMEEIDEFVLGGARKADPRMTLRLTDMAPDEQNALLDLVERFYDTVSDKVVVEGAVAELTGAIRGEAPDLVRGLTDNIPESAKIARKARKQMSDRLLAAKNGRRDEALRPLTHPVVLRAAGYKSRDGAGIYSRMIERQLDAGDAWIEDIGVLEKGQKAKDISTKMFSDLTHAATPASEARRIRSVGLQAKVAGKDVQGIASAIIEDMTGLTKDTLGRKELRRLRKKRGDKTPSWTGVPTLKPMAIRARAKEIAESPLKVKALFDDARSRALENMALDPDGGLQVSSVILKDALVDPKHPLHKAVKPYMDSHEFAKMPRESALDVMRAKAEGKLGGLDPVEKVVLNLGDGGTTAAKKVAAAYYNLSKNFEELRTKVIKNMDTLFEISDFSDLDAVARMNKYFAVLNPKYNEKSWSAALKYSPLEDRPLAMSKHWKPREGGAELAGENQSFINSMADVLDDTNLEIQNIHMMQALKQWATETSVVPKAGKMLPAEGARRGVRTYIDGDNNHYYEITQGDTIAGRAKSKIPGNEKSVINYDDGDWFYSDRTGEIYKWIHPDDAKWRDFKGSLAEQTFYDFATTSTPDNLTGAMGAIVKPLKRAMGGVKATLVAKNIPSVARNILSNVAVMLAGFGGSRALVATAEAAADRNKWLKGKPSKYEAFANAGIETSTMARADMLLQEKTSKAYTALQEVAFAHMKRQGPIGNRADVLRMADSKAARAIGELMRSPGKTVESTSAILMSFFQTTEVTMKAGIAYGFEKSVVEFVDGLKSLAGDLRPLGFSDETIESVAIHGPRSPYNADVVAAYAKLYDIQAPSASWRIASTLGTAPGKSGLPSYFRFWGDSADAIETGVRKAIADPAASGVAYGNKLLFDYSRVNGLTNVARGVGAAVGAFNPFLTWELMAMKLTGDWIASNPIKSAVLGHAGEISGKYIMTHMPELDPDEGEELWGKLAPADKMDLTPLGIGETRAGNPTLETVNLAYIAGHAGFLKAQSWFPGGETPGGALGLPDWVPPAVLPFQSGYLEGVTRPGTKGDTLGVLQALAGLKIPPFLVRGAVNTFKAKLGMPTHPGGTVYETTGQAIANSMAAVKIKSMPLSEIRRSYGMAMDRASGQTSKDFGRMGKARAMSQQKFTNETETEYAERMMSQGMLSNAIEWMLGSERDRGLKEMNRVRGQVGQPPLK